MRKPATPTKTAKDSSIRAKSPRGRGESLRDEILDAAEQLLIETGSESQVSIRAVAQAVGVTAPSIYMHFVDKETLMMAVCEKQFADLDEAMTTAATQAEDPLHELHLRGRAYIDYGLSHPESYRLMFMCRHDADDAEAVREQLERVSAFGDLVDAVERAIDGGMIQHDDPLLVALGLWISAHGITSLLIAHPMFPWLDTDTMIEHVLETSLAALVTIEQ